MDEEWSKKVIVSAHMENLVKKRILYYLENFSAKWTKE